MVMIILIIVIIAGVYFRIKFDSKYVVPVMKENNLLASMSKACVIAIGLALGFYFFNFKKLSFFILIILIPIVLFINFKTYTLATKKFLKKKD